MAIISFQAPTAVNPFAGDVSELLAADIENAASEHIVANDKVTYTKNKIGKAANDADRTAKFVVEEPGKKDGTTRIVYVLRPKYAPKIRKPKDAESAPAEVVEATAE